MTTVQANTVQNDPAIGALANNFGKPAPLATTKLQEEYRIDGKPIKGGATLASDAAILANADTNIVKFIGKAVDASRIHAEGGEPVPFNPAKMQQQFADCLAAAIRMMNPKNAGETLHVASGLLSDSGELVYNAPPIKAFRALTKGITRDVAAIKKAAKS